MSVGGEIKYVFVASGHDGVLSAFRSIDEAAKQSARVAAAEAAKGAKARKRAETDVAHEQEQSQKAAQRRAAAEAKAAERSAERRAKQMIAAETARERAAEAAYRKIVRQLDDEAKAAERSAARRKAAAERAKAAESKAALKSWDSSASAVRGLASKGFGAAIGAAGLALGTVGAAARESVSLGDVARRLAISARGAGEKAADPTALQREFENTAIGTPGISANDVAAGTQLYVSKTGDLATARSMQHTFATVASATGSEYADIAGSAADIAQKFDIKGVEAMQQAFATLTFQGKKGAFELKDAASYFSEMASAAQRFGVGSGPKALATLGGLAQIARTATGSAAEASTAVQDMFAELVAKSDTIKKKHGVDVFDDQGKARDVRDVLTELIGHTGGADLAKKKSELQHIFGTRGSRAVSPLISAFSEAALATKGDDEKKVSEGMKAVRVSLEDAITAPGTWKDVIEDDAAAQRTVSAQLTAAWEELKAKTTEQLTPALVTIAPKLAGLVTALDPAITAFGLLVDAATGFLDFLKENHLVREKKKTAADYDRDLKLFDERMRASGVGANGRLMTEAERRERDGIRSGRDAALAKENRPLRKGMSEDEFVRDFVAERSKNPLLPGSDAGFESGRAKEIYQALLENPNEEVALHDNKFNRLLGSDTEEQIKLIGEMGEIATFGRTFRAGQGLREGVPGSETPLEGEAGRDLSADEMATSARDAAKALDAFNERLQRVNPNPMILGGVGF
jgi:Phage-related minor tail protein